MGKTVRKLEVLKGFTEMNFVMQNHFTLFGMLHNVVSKEKPEEVKGLHRSVRMIFKIEE